MARPRKFDETDVLRTAMMMFWRDGYAATTYAQIERETGVGARSLVNTFGDKAALFDRALALYTDMVRGILAEVFATPGRDSIAMLFGSLTMPTEPDDIANAGCLMVQTVFGLAQLEPSVRTAVEDYRALFRGHFRDALAADGVADAQARADFLLGALWGILSHIRLAGATEAAAPMAEVTVKSMMEWS